MAVGKEIKNKIGSVQNTQKITSAMQMVAASKMRRTQQRMAEGKPYSERIRGVIGHLANSNPEYKHIYMDEREIKRVGYIIISTDRGLCGGLNVNLFRTVVRELAEWHNKGIEADLGLIGNKAGAGDLIKWPASFRRIRQQVPSECSRYEQIIRRKIAATRAFETSHVPIVVDICCAGWERHHDMLWPSFLGFESSVK